MSTATTVDYDVIIVGAGFAGLYAVHKLRGQGLKVQGFERGGDVGGTWYWNRYPGARCDVESLEYSYSFCEELQQEWKWPEKYSAQPEILSYINHVADRFDLRPSFRFNTSVAGATFNEDQSTWTVRLEDGEERTARYLILAVGCLSTPMLPQIDGMDDFSGRILHPGQWPHEGVDFAGKRVGIIGTGSSGLQMIPVVAEDAEELVVFQRTATWTFPARNAPLDPAEESRVKADYADFRRRNRAMPGARGADRLDPNPRSIFTVSEEERNRIFEDRWAEGGMVIQTTFSDLRSDMGANGIVADFLRSKIREIVKDPATAELLSPKHTLGCKRMCIDTNYYETFNRPNVRLVDTAANPITRFTERGPVAGETEYPLDYVIFATGYDAMTGSILRIDVQGRDGVSLKDAWEAGPRTYLGLATVGFPNLFIMAGPGSPSVLANVIVAIEQHVDWVADAIHALDEAGAKSIEPTPEAQDEWVDHVNAVAATTLYTTCNSWYLGANVPGKARVFMPLLGFPAYEAKCNEVAANGYSGFVIRK